MKVTAYNLLVSVNPMLMVVFPCTFTEPLEISGEYVPLAPFVVGTEYEYVPEFSRNEIDRFDDFSCPFSVSDHAVFGGRPDSVKVTE